MKTTPVMTPHAAAALRLPRMGPARRDPAPATPPAFVRHLRSGATRLWRLLEEVGRARARRDLLAAAARARPGDPELAQQLERAARGLPR